jgi:hypothetical protein
MASNYNKPEHCPWNSLFETAGIAILIHRVTGNDVYITMVFVQKSHEAITNRRAMSDDSVWLYLTRTWHATVREASHAAPEIISAIAPQRKRQRGHCSA